LHQRPDPSRETSPLNHYARAGVLGPGPGDIRAADVGGVHRSQDPCQLSPPHRMQESSGTKGDKKGIVKTLFMVDSHHTDPNVIHHLDLDSDPELYLIRSNESGF